MSIKNIVFSPTGGTKKAADIIAKELSDNIEYVDLTDAKFDFSNVNIEKNDIAIIAMPSYGGRAPQIAIRRLNQIKGNSAAAIIICVYGNRDYEDTLNEMYDESQKCNFNVIAAISAVAEHSIIREIAAGRPNLKDEEELRKFADKIKENIQTTQNTPIISANRPYKNNRKGNFILETSKLCINCGKCAKLCPTEAIDKINSEKIDTEKCISCMRCVAVCPQSAKKIKETAVKSISDMLKKVCINDRKNELFI